MCCHHGYIEKAMAVIIFLPVSLDPLICESGGCTMKTNEEYINWFAGLISLYDLMVSALQNIGMETQSTPERLMG